MSGIGNEDQEKTLKTLTEANRPENRAAWALRAKEDGKPVVGLLCASIPEEIVLAAGMFPWRVTGTWEPTISKALLYRDSDMCKYCNHALESMLNGEMDFLSALIASDWDDDRRRLFDVWKHYGKQTFSAIISAPRLTTEAAQRYFAKELRNLISLLEKWSGSSLEDEALGESIRVLNRTRSLLHEVYDLRKREHPPLTGAEVLGLTTAATVMDKRVFNQTLGGLMPFLANRKADLDPARPRILVSSDLLDNPAYFELVESEGCTIVMDDLDTGSRYFWGLVNDETSDRVSALAERYVLRPQDPAGFEWEKQNSQVLSWVKDFKVDGVIELVEDFSAPRRWKTPFLAHALKEVGIPHVKISREYGFAPEVAGPLRTRIGAFLEMLELDR